MPDTKKEQERAKLHSTIWKIANDLRGSVDGWDFKQYVLGMLLYRFISENLTNYINHEERKTGDSSFDYSSLGDSAAEFGRKDTVSEKGFYILPSELFENVRGRAKSDDNLNETLSKIFRNIENSAKGTASEEDVKGLFDDIDVNSNKLGSTVEKRNKLLVRLLDAVGDLDLGSYKDNTIDAFGDAYEYLMGMYASNAGKSGGEYYTPQEVSELLTSITIVGKERINKVYDPAVGSGSLLLKFRKLLGDENVGGYYGQEINLTTYNLARINMFLHDISYEKFYIAHGDTLLEPQHDAHEPFDAIVSNPPYSIHWAGDSDPLLINNHRFSPAGVLAPKNRADMAFIMHSLSYLSTVGTAAIVEFPGVMYRGGAEQKIRKYLIENNFIDAVIQLPGDLFFGTNIATCILVIKKSKSDNSTLFIDASLEFVRHGNKNKLSVENSKRILDAYVNRKDVEHFARLVPNSEIAANKYNTAVSNYVKPEDNTVEVDITELNSHIHSLFSKQADIRRELDGIVSDIESAKTSKINNLISKYCPDGVEYRKLGKLGKRNKGVQITAAQMKVLNKPGAPIRIFAGGKTVADVEETVIPNANIIYQPSIIVKSRGHISFTYYEKPFTHKNELWSYTISDDEINQKYVYYCLQNHITELQVLARAKSVKIPQLAVSDTDNLQIPLPPKAIQDEIVHVLDSLSQLEIGLKEELTQEIANRRTQYEYYQNKLLSFQELDS